MSSVFFIMTAEGKGVRSGRKESGRPYRQMTACRSRRAQRDRSWLRGITPRGAPIASLYSTDFAEVRLPIHDEELAFLELPLATGDNGDSPLPTAILRARFAGKEHEWRGKVVRTEGELDPQTRMINVVAQVEAPYKTTGDRPPLAVGLFVEAEILGKVVDDIYVIPRSALQANDQVYIIGVDNTVEFRDVDIARIIGEKVYLRGGLATGETVCLSTLNNAIQGMSVRPVAREEQGSS